MSFRLQNNDTCGCCKGIKALTPTSLDNLPGLSSLAYKVGTHGSFKTTMKAALSCKKALGGLTIRDDDELSIALIDAWACVLDVLTFYQERIANEGYLLTASERGSVLQLARAIGYELKPGVAASTFLTFTLEDAPGTPGYALIDKGVKVMSIPGQDEKPQTFETIERIEARAEWNELKPKLTELKIPEFGSKEVYLKGTATGLKPGDGLLFVGKEREQDSESERWDFRIVKTAIPDMAAGYTKVTWEKGLGWQRFSRKVLPAAEELKVYAFRVRASLFGHNAPDWRSMPDSVKKGYLSRDPTPDDIEWPNFKISSNNTIYLDAVYPGIVQGSWIVLSIPNYEEIYKVKDVEGTSSTDYTLTAKTTRLTLSGEKIKEKFDNARREMVVFAQSEELEIAEAPRTDLLSGNAIEVDRLVSGLEKGRLLIISGKRKTATVALKAGGLKLISTDGEKSMDLRPGEKLQVLESPIKEADEIFWKLMDRNGFVGSVIAPVDSIQLESAAPENPTISEVAVFEGTIENTFTERLKIIEEVSKGAISKTALKVLKGKWEGEIPEKGYNQIVGWNGESYVALGGKINKLARLVLEQGADEKKVINEGEIWNIGGGWQLAVQKINGKNSLKKVIPERSSSKKACLVLTKDGIKKDETDVAQGSIYAYIEKGVAGESDIPLFVTYVDTISTGNSGGVQLRYTWAVDTNITEIITGNKLILSDNASFCTGEKTILVFKEAMQNSYDPATVTIHANVVRATHGETVHEVLGSGNGAQANQRFTLKKQPVTYVPAPTSSGTESTIEVRVNDIAWQEVPSLYGLDQLIRCYISRMDDEGGSALIFGDGKRGARLPTGQENVLATYRTGIGMQGMVRAGQLSLLMTRPLGVKGVTNPLAPTGAADPETRDQAKQNAPQKVLTLDRIVSLQDFEDFARAFAGIGKAQAVWLWDGEARFVHITVASADAGTVDKASELYNNLWLGIERVKDPVQQFRIDPFNPLFFNLSASVRVDSRYIKEKILAAVKEALKQTFSFEQRNFGQAVTESEVLATIQRVEGVEAVDLNYLYMKGKLPELNTYLKADKAHQYEGSLFSAELLTLNPEGIELTEMTL